MLIFNMKEIGNNLYSARKRRGFTQAYVGESANISDRTYADIERGNTDMRISTLLKICSALHVEPNDILTRDDKTEELTESEIMDLLSTCNLDRKKTALRLLQVYISAVKGD